LLHESVQLGAVLAREFDRSTAFEELLNLFLGEHICVLHAYLHPAAVRLASSHFRDHLVLESIRVSGSSCIGQFCQALQAKNKVDLKG
jgi:hypothetical protein